MTLMLTFFVLLFSFASFDSGAFEDLFTNFTKTLSTVNPPVKKDKSAFVSTEQILPTGYFDEGSEKVTTLAREDEARAENNLTEDTESADFRNRKVFLFPSKRLFWGKGMAISPEGRNTLSTMASFLKEMPSRIVISENGPDEDEDSEQLGLPRAWAVLKYFATVQNLDKKRFSISVASTLAQASLKSSEPASPGSERERMLEIVLLERSIYN